MCNIIAKAIKQHIATPCHGNIMARTWQRHRTTMVNTTCKHDIIHIIAFACTIIAKALQTQFKHTWQKHYNMYITRY
jgi:hypothetical protein